MLVSVWLLLVVNIGVLVVVWLYFRWVLLWCSLRVLLILL